VSVSLLLWDFGDTLVDEHWMRRAPRPCSTWGRSWVEVTTDLADAWNAGAVTSAQVFEAMADRTGMSVQGVELHARDCCQQIVFHTAAWRYARQRCSHSLTLSAV
jgi:hypothetical protein